MLIVNKVLKMKSLTGCLLFIFVVAIVSEVDAQRAPFKENFEIGMSNAEKSRMITLFFLHMFKYHSQHPEFDEQNSYEPTQSDRVDPSDVRNLCLRADEWRDYALLFLPFVDPKKATNGVLTSICWQTLDEVARKSSKEKHRNRE